MGVILKNNAVSTITTATTPQLKSPLRQLPLARSPFCRVPLKSLGSPLVPTSQGRQLQVPLWCM